MRGTGGLVKGKTVEHTCYLDHGTAAKAMLLLGMSDMPRREGVGNRSQRPKDPESVRVMDCNERLGYALLASLLRQTSDGILSQKSDKQSIFLQALESA